MSTDVSTDLPTEVQEQLQAMFAAAQTTLRKREQDAKARNAAAVQAQQAEISNSWAEALLSLYGVLPIWIYPYIQQPTVMYTKQNRERGETEYSFVEITVPGCNPIAAWITPGRGGTVRYEVMQPHLFQDEDTDVWYVSNIMDGIRHNKWAIEQIGDWDIAVTLFKAHEAFLTRLDLEFQAEQRNTYEPEPAPIVPDPDPAPVVPDPIDQARQLVNMLSNSKLIKQVRMDTSEEAEDFADERTLVLSAVGLAVAHHVSRVADALEHIQWR